MSADHLITKMHKPDPVYQAQINRKGRVWKVIKVLKIVKSIMCIIIRSDDLKHEQQKKEEKNVDHSSAVGAIQTGLRLS